MLRQGFDGMLSPLFETKWLSNELSRMFRGSEPTGSDEGFPRVNLWSSERGLIVTAEVPGVAPDELEVSVDGRMLTIAGERRADEPGSDGRFVRRERAHGKFARKVRLPFEVEPDAIDARFRHGVLEIKLPRPADRQPRKIEVQAHA